MTKAEVRRGAGVGDEVPAGAGSLACGEVVRGCEGDRGDRAEKQSPEKLDGRENHGWRGEGGVA